MIHDPTKSPPLEMFYFGQFKDDIIYQFLDSRGPCSRRYCNTNSYCVESGDLAYCECPTCNLHYTPVCGSDGVTYSNECFLRKASCDKEEEISVVSQGSCSKLFQMLSFIVINLNHSIL